jgi:serine/threonine-protein kinase
MRLTPEQWERIKSLFPLASEQAPNERDSFLLRECPDDEVVRGEIARLLGSEEDRKRDEFLETGPAKAKYFKALNCESGDILAGRFKVIRFLAMGGMGEVYEAEDLELQERVAIKLIRQEVLFKQNEALKWFKREIRFAKQVTHPNVCRIFDLFRHPSPQSGSAVDPGATLLLVSMELLQGETLADRLRRTGKMSMAEALPIVQQMASALQAAHERQILHRDFKPGNVFLVPSRESGRVRVVVTDFGLARGLSSDPSKPTLTPISIDQVLGTPAYMSPEQLEPNRDLTPASDVYSFGLVMYQMVTGTIPFENETPIVMVARRLRDPLASPRLYTPELSRTWESVILRCLEREPSRRFSCAAEIAAAISSKAMPRVRSGKAFKSLAILPFLNVSGAPDAEYLSDGITETIINTLSRIPDLRVIARSSAFRYKARDTDPQMAGRQLNVDSVLTGRVIQRCGTLNIATELVDVSTGWQLWGENYKRTPDDILSVQEEIAHEISVKLRLKLSVDEKRKLAKRPTKSSQAYQLFLRGRFHWNKKTEPDIRRSIEYFNQAIESDPTFAQAYVGLADAYATLGFFLVASFPPREVMPKAHAAAIRALELDDALAEAHASLGMITMRFKWDLQGALSLFHRALELNPGCGFALQWSGECWAAMGNLAESIAALKRAQEFDPLSLTINAVLGGMLCFARKYDLSIEQCQKTLEMDSHFWPALKFLGVSYLQNGNLGEAEAVLERGVRDSENNPIMVATLGHAYAVAGMPARAEELLASLNSRSPHGYVPSLCSAFIQMGLGNRDAAFSELEKAFEERSGWLMFLRVDPRFDSLHSDPRFHALLQRIGLLSRESAA